MTVFNVLLPPGHSVLLPQLLALEVVVDLLAPLLRDMGHHSNQSSVWNLLRTGIDALLKLFHLTRVLTEVAVLLQLRLACLQSLGTWFRVLSALRQLRPRAACTPEVRLRPAAIQVKIWLGFIVAV